MPRKTRKEWLSDAPPRPWLLWTIRGLLGGFALLTLAVGVPAIFIQIHDIRTTMPYGPERQAAIDGVIEQAVRLLLVPLFLLAVFGFGVFPRKATDVWSTGGPWFVPLWRSDKKKTRTRNDARRPTDNDSCVS